MCIVEEEEEVAEGGGCKYTRLRTRMEREILL